LATIALIGSDGAGKTTIAHMLIERAPCPVKYLYMGINIESSNRALPSSRLIDFLNRKFRGNFIKQSNSELGNKKSLSFCHRCSRNFRAAIRLIFRLSEESYRQLVSWLYQLRGYLVIYDRHFIYDFDCDILNFSNRNGSLSERIHRWFLANYYPRPDLVIYLVAPPEILLSRKPESPHSYLVDRERAFNRQQYKNKQIIRVCTKKSLEVTYQEVVYHLKNIFDRCI
jgi:thymidylate kinase